MSITVTQTETSVARETDILKTNILELREKLTEVDRSLNGLTNLVADFMKSTGHPITDQTNAFLQSIKNVCGQKRNCSFDCPPVQHKRTILTPDNVSVDTPPSGDEQCLDLGEGDESDDTDSMCDLLTLCKQEKEELLEHSSEADFDKFLSFIAGGKVSINCRLDFFFIAQI